MANHKLVPSKTEMRRFLQQGLTQQQIADRWEEETGIRVTRVAIGMAISRYGLQSAKPRPRHTDTIPWRVRTEHEMAREVRMLRHLGRRRRGLPLKEEEQQRLDKFLRELKEKDAVIFYAPEVGFQWLPRNEYDTDVVRAELHNSPRGSKTKKRSA